MLPPSLAVLVSGGIDSAILLARAARTCTAVVPIYVRCGLRWESAEFAHLQRFHSALSTPKLRTAVALDVPIADVYESHWSVTGRDTPDADSADQAVYLPGRNVVLLSKPLLWCHLNRVPALALAVLDGNPFPDATPEFFEAMAATVNRAVGGSVRIETPYSRMSKVEVLRLGKDLPLELTFSCIAPVDSRHCGQCNKCAERRRAFAEAGLDDRTQYDRG